MALACELLRSDHQKRAGSRKAEAEWRSALDALPDILAAICQFAEDALTDAHCAIYLIDWQKPSIRLGAAPSLPGSFSAAICAAPLRPDGSPCMRAACLEAQVIAEDLSADPGWREGSFRSLALAHGLASCCSTPIAAGNGDVLGTFAVLRPVAGRPTPLEQGLIARIVSVARVAIEHARTLEALRRCEAALTETGFAPTRWDLKQMARTVGPGPLSAALVREARHPLSGILINVSTGLRMLAGGPPDVAGAQDALRRATRDSRRAADIIERLHKLFDRREPRLVPVDLNDAAQEVVSLLLSELQRDRVSLRTAFQDGLPPVSGDRAQLQQVVFNLLLNASEAMAALDDRPRLLVVGTELAEDGQPSLYVRDTGPGLDDEAADRIFEPFFTTRQNGLGMGLFVSRAIIERHGGSLRASAHEGPGATFSFSIPCVPGQA